MSTTNTWALFAVMAACAACSKDQPKSTAASASASASAAPTASVAAAPSASASAEPEVQHDCPAGSTGKGSSSHPCEAKGADRMVTITWTGKSDKDGSPWFSVVSKAPKTMLYGHLALYFYDKKGKQITVKDPVEGSDKTHAYHTCGGNVFAGGLNPSEHARYTFSCMKKADVPDGTAAIEGEATEVGFVTPDLNKKTEFFWKNADLAPEARPKGGIKAKKK
jgi:hypothetical protein